MKHVLTFSLLVLAAGILPASAQKAKKEKTLTADEAKEVKKDANTDFGSGNFNTALQQYKDLVKSDPQNKEYNFRLGYCYLRAHANKAHAADYLEKGIAPKDKTKENYYYLGLAYHYAGRYDEAIEKYGQYKSAGGKAMKGFMDPGRLMEMCENAQELDAGPHVKVTFTNLGKMINTPFDEYNPMVSGDGRTLAFTSRRKGNLGEMNDELGFPADVFFSTYKDSLGWQKAKGAGVNINTDGDEEVAGINPMGDVLLLTLNNVDGVNDLAMSLVKGKSYQKYSLLSSINMPKNPSTSGFLTNDGKTLYFSAERTEKDKKVGQGGYDIWVSHLEDNGNWSKPENLGPDVNTFYDDKYPTLSVDGKTMYFSSQGYNSMGGFDIFKTTFDDNTETWSEPVNLGPPINTPDDEISFSVAGNGREAYMAVARDDGMGERDIYKVSFEDETVAKFMTVIKGKVIVSSNPKATFDKVELKDKKTGKVVCTFGTPAPNTGKEYLLAAVPGEYTIEVSGSNFKTYTEDVSITTAMTEPLIKDLTIDAAKP